jgi:hypothetical protein
MSTFEKYMRSSSAVSDTSEPNAGHYERFLRKLEQQKLRDQNHFIIRVLARAAVIAIIVSTSVIGVQFIRNNFFTSTAMPSELAEAESYYISLVNKNVELIAGNPYFRCYESRSIVLKELGLPDDEYLRMKAELSQNPNNSYIIRAMVDYMRTKAETTRQILAHLPNTHTQNTSNF